MKKVLVTGATGFIGQSLIKSLLHLNRPVRGTIRSSKSLFLNKKIEYVSIGDINCSTDWKESLIDVDCIIHCAAKVHEMKLNKNNLSKIYQSVNVDGTEQLARQAVKAKVKRFIFLSSIKVNGENTMSHDLNESFELINKSIFSHQDLECPKDLYAKSKLKAEKVLWEISSRTGLELVVMRLPLVYGYGAKGNLARLIKLIKLGIPLPLSLVKNKRSMIGIDNLVNLLIRCIDHQEAAGKTLLASESKHLSTPEFIRLIASSMERKAHLFPLPIFMLELLGSIFGKREEVNRLVGSLMIDNSHTMETLNWKPTIDVEEGVRRMIQGK